MKSITSKGVVKKELEICLRKFDTKNSLPFVDELLSRLLNVKIKFPLLEYCASEIYLTIPENSQIKVCDEIASLKTIGGNVLIGIILQKRLDKHFNQSLKKAAEYIAAGNEWYVTDIIGERVYGWSLLHEPGKTLPELKKLSRHESTWVVRSLGAGSHYAIKKGLDKKNVEEVFKLLLSLSDAKNFHVKTGIGWAAKTTAKFHPEIIKKYSNELSQENVGQWFRGKVKIGLERNEYVKARRSKNHLK